MFNQINFPYALPGFYLFFTGDCAEHVSMQFKIHQQMCGMLPGKTIDQIIFVFPDAFYQITGYAGIECAVAFVGEDVNRGLFTPIVP